VSSKPYEVADQSAVNARQQRIEVVHRTNLCNLSTNRKEDKYKKTSKEMEGPVLILESEQIK
jgi:hypothetical protein